MLEFKLKIDYSYVLVENQFILEIDAKLLFYILFIQTAASCHLVS